MPFGGGAFSPFGGLGAFGGLNAFGGIGGMGSPFGAIAGPGMLTLCEIYHELQFTIQIHVYI